MQRLSLLPILISLLGCTSAPIPELKYPAADPTSWQAQAPFSTRISPKTFDAAIARAACFHATNDMRRLHKLSALERVDRLEGSAQLFSDRMTAENFFDHIDPYSAALRTPNDRGISAGIANPKFAENLAMVTTIKYRSGAPAYALGPPGVFSYTPGGPAIASHTYASLANELLREWMSSPGHRRNIMDPNALQLGCGITFLWQSEFPSVNAVQNFQLYEPVRTE